MSFPLTYRLKIPLDQAIYIADVEETLKKFFRRYQSSSSSPIKYKSSFLGYRYPINYSLENQTVTLNIHFTPVINTILFFFLITGLLSSISFFTFLWLSLALSIAFYGITFLIVTHQLQNEINRLFGIRTELQKEGQFSEEQAQWLNDASRCPACGTPLNEKQLYCPSCGLRVQQNRYSKPLEIK